MDWDLPMHEAWTAGWYRDGEQSLAAREARRAGGAARHPAGSNAGLSAWSDAEPSPPARRRVSSGKPPG